MNKTTWQHNPRWNGKISAVNTSFVLLTPLLSLILIPLYLHFNGIRWSDFGIFMFMMTASGLSITAGYHRLFSHQSYECHPLVRLFYLLFGAAAFQNSAYKWSSDHRYHHRFVDKDGDPYRIQKGFFYAHIGWIFFGDPEGRSFDNIRDLQKDKLVLWQHKYFIWIATLVGFVFPAFLGFLVGRPFAGLLWGGLFRIVYVHHGTFFINSAAHVFGTRPYSLKNSARDSWWLAFFTNGEGFHNFHHAFSNDYRNGIRWYHWDPSKWLICSLKLAGLSNQLRATPDWQIYRAKLESAHETIKAGNSVSEHAWTVQYHAQLDSLKLAIEDKIRELAELRSEYQERLNGRREADAWDGRVRKRYFRKRIHASNLAIQNAWKEYRALAKHSKQLEQF